MLPLQKSTMHFPPVNVVTTPIWSVYSQSVVHHVAHIMSHADTLPALPMNYFMTEDFTTYRHDSSGTVRECRFQFGNTKFRRLVCSTAHQQIVPGWASVYVVMAWGIAVTDHGDSSVNGRPQWHIFVSLYILIGVWTSKFHHCVEAGIIQVWGNESRDGVEKYLR